MYELSLSLSLSLSVSLSLSLFCSHKLSYITYLGLSFYLLFQPLSAFFWRYNNIFLSIALFSFFNPLFTIYLYLTRWIALFNLLSFFLYAFAITLPFFLWFFPYAFPITLPLFLTTSHLFTYWRPIYCQIAAFVLEVHYDIYFIRLYPLFNYKML